MDGRYSTNTDSKRGKLINSMLQCLGIKVSLFDGRVGFGSIAYYVLIILTLESQCLIMKKHRHGEELAIHE